MRGWGEIGNPLEGSGARNRALGTGGAGQLVGSHGSSRGLCELQVDGAPSGPVKCTYT